MRAPRLLVGVVLLACGSATAPAVPTAVATESAAAADGCPAAPPADTVAPVVHEVTVAASSVDVTAGPVEVPVRVLVTDSGGDAAASGVASVAVDFQVPGFVPSRWPQPGGRAQLTPAGGDWWAGVLTVSRWVAYSGDWDVYQVEAWDTAGNQVLAPGALEGRPAPRLTIAPHPLDTLQPFLADLVLGRTTVDARRRTAHLRVRVHATDTGGSGVSAVTVGGAPLFRVSGTADDGWWAGGIAVPRWGPDGVRRISAVTSDAAGNRTWSYTRRLRDRGLPWRYTVRSNPDVSVPHARRVRLGDSAVETVPAGALVPVDVRVVDDLSGARRVRAVLRGADGSWRWSAALGRRAGSRRDGVWRGALTLPCRFPVGDYSLELRLTDRAGNGRTVASGLTLRVG